LVLKKNKLMLVVFGPKDMEPKPRLLVNLETKKAHFTDDVAHEHADKKKIPTKKVASTDYAAWAEKSGYTIDETPLTNDEIKALL